MAKFQLLNGRINETVKKLQQEINVNKTMILSSLDSNQFYHLAATLPIQFWFFHRMREIEVVVVFDALPGRMSTEKRIMTMRMMMATATTKKRVSIF